VVLARARMRRRRDGVPGMNLPLSVCFLVILFTLIDLWESRDDD
jgi:hypothetical protein